MQEAAAAGVISGAAGPALAAAAEGAGPQAAAAADQAGSATEVHKAADVETSRVAAGVGRGSAKGAGGAGAGQAGRPPPPHLLVLQPRRRAAGEVAPLWIYDSLQLAEREQQAAAQGPGRIAGEGEGGQGRGGEDGGPGEGGQAGQQVTGPADGSTAGGVGSGPAAVGLQGRGGALLPKPALLTWQAAPNPDHRTSGSGQGSGGGAGGGRGPAAPPSPTLLQKPALQRPRPPS